MDDRAAYLQALLERVKATTEADRELDAAVWFAAEGRQFSDVRIERMGYSIATPAFAYATDGTFKRLLYIDPVTTSLEAALALLKRTLPNTLCDIIQLGAAPEIVEADAPLDFERYAACIHPVSPMRGRAEYGKHTTRAGAVVVALLQMLCSQAERGDKDE